MDNPLLKGLHDAGISLTGQRRAICEWLDRCDTHPTAADIYDALRPVFSPLSLATVYNTLSLLEKHGLIYAVDTTPAGHTRYEVVSKPHINLTRRGAGEIIDVDDAALLAEARRVAVQHGFDPDRVSVILVVADSGG